MKFYYLIFIFLLFYSCKDKTDYSLTPSSALVKKFTDKFPDFKFPKKITIQNKSNFIIINKIYNDSIKETINLFQRNNKYYIFSTYYDQQGNYLGAKRNLYLKKGTKDSCYSIEKDYLLTSEILGSLSGTDICFNKFSERLYRTVIKNSAQNEHYNEHYYEIYFYDKNYRISKISLNYKNFILTYK